MAKKIFVISAFGAGAEDAKYAALIWARKQGTAFTKEMGKPNFFYTVGEEEQSGKKFAKKLSNKFGDTSPADYVVFSGWKVAQSLPKLYAQFKDEAIFIFVRRYPEEIADKFAKGFFLKRPGKMATLDENSYLEKVKIQRQLIEDFVTEHNLEWIRVAAEIFDENLEPKASAAETTAKRDIIVLKPTA
jgi:ABC-type antimicrobial peptide transport system permease subunit